MLGRVCGLPKEVRYRLQRTPESEAGPIPDRFMVRQRVRSLRLGIVIQSTDIAQSKFLGGPAHN